MLELLLRDKRVDASSYLFLLREKYNKPFAQVDVSGYLRFIIEKYKTPSIHFITLKQFIREVKPSNMD